MNKINAKLRLWKNQVPNGVWEFFRIDKAFRWERLDNDVSRGVVIFFRFITVWAFGLVAFSGPTPGSFYSIMHNNSTILALPNATRANWSLEATWVVVSQSYWLHSRDAPSKFTQSMRSSSTQRQYHTLEGSGVWSRFQKQTYFRQYLHIKFVS